MFRKTLFSNSLKTVFNKKKILRIFVGVSFCFFILIGLLERVIASPSTITPGTIQLLSENKSVSVGAKLFWIGIHHQLQEGWHAYWRYAGDSGLPLKVTWSKVINARVGDVRWPLPKVFRAGPLITYGYEKEVVLLVPVYVRGAGTVELEATIDWLVCKDICIPQRTDTAIKIPSGDGKMNQPVKRLFDRMRSTVPSVFPWKVKGYFNSPSIILHVNVPKNVLSSINSVTFLPMYDGLIENGESQSWQTIQLGSTNSLEIRLKGGYALKERGRKLNGVLILGKGKKTAYKPAAFYLLDVPLLDGKILYNGVSNYE